MGYTDPGDNRRAFIRIPV